jgi:hypothetical protein
MRNDDQIADCLDMRVIPAFLQHFGNGGEMLGKFPIHGKSADGCVLGKRPDSSFPVEIQGENRRVQNYGSKHANIPRIGDIKSLYFILIVNIELLLMQYVARRAVFYWTCAHLPYIQRVADIPGGNFIIAMENERVAQTVDAEGMFHLDQGTGAIHVIQIQQITGFFPAGCLV